MTIANRMGEAQPRLRLTPETPRKPKRTSARDEGVLKEVCRSLEAAGLSVVVVVALDASSALTATGHALRRVRRSLETTGLSVVADHGNTMKAPANHRSSKASLALVRDEAENRGSGPGEVARGGKHAGPVIVLTTAADVELARAAFVSGGLGYIVSPNTAGPAATASSFVARSGERRQASAPATSPSDSSNGPVLGHGLTSREFEVMRVLATGASTVEIARELYVSPKTAKNHIAHIYAKLGVKSRTQAVAKALRQGIVQID